MVTTQRNFETALKKGELGEQIIRKHLEDRGWIVYIPFTKDKAHYFDMMATLNKEKAIAVDVKTKARLNKWDAQGIDIKQYNQYIKFTKTCNIPFYLVFVDDKTGDVHLADISKLKNPISVNKNIVAWKLKEMKFLFKISNHEVQELSKYDQRNYKFTPKKFC
jgi:hypothetical protein